MFIYQGADYSKEYICVPHTKSDKEIWTNYFSDLENDASFGDDQKLRPDETCSNNFCLCPTGEHLREM